MSSFRFHLCSCIHKLLMIVGMLMLVLDEVEGIDKKFKPKQRRRGGRSRGRASSEDLDLGAGFWMIGVLLGLITLPIIGSFLYSVVKDPMTPSVLQNGWDVAKQRYFGYLGQLSEMSGIGDPKAAAAAAAAVGNSGGSTVSGGVGGQSPRGLRSRTRPVPSSRRHMDGDGRIGSGSASSRSHDAHVLEEEAEGTRMDDEAAMGDGAPGPDVFKTS